MNHSANLNHRLVKYLTMALGLSVAGISSPDAKADAVWNGSTSSDWNNGSNWTGGSPGTGNNDVIVNNAGTFQVPVLSGNGSSSRDIRIGAGANGRLDQTAGTLSTGNGSWFFVGYAGATASFNLANTAASGGTLTGFGQGTGSVNVGGASQNGDLLIALDGGTSSTVNMNTSGTLAAGMVSMGSAGSNATNTFNIDNGTVTVGGEFQVGGDVFGQGNGSNNVLNMSGGSITANIMSFSRGDNNGNTMHGTANITGGTLNSRSWFTLGFAGAAGAVSTINNNGGAININTTGGGNLEMGVFDGTTNQFTVNSGSVTLQNNASMLFGNGGNHSGASTFTQNGGTVAFYSDAGTTIGGTGVLNLGVGSSTGTYAYNLNGGTLTVPKIQKAAAGASGSFNFNGGTLKAAADNANFLTGITTANVRNGGAIIDTNSHNITVAQALAHSNIGGDAATDGGLTKNGNGTLTLTGANTLTGSVVINGGTLYASRGNAANNQVFSYVTDITVNNGATLEGGANSLFGWDGSQEHPITVNAGGTLLADTQGDIGVSLVTLNGGTLATSAANADAGTWRFDGATDKLLVTDNSTVSAVNVKFQGGGAIEVASGKALNFTGTITDTNSFGISSVVKNGNGTLNLAGANTYTGNTTINAGTLDLTSSGSMKFVIGLNAVNNKVTGTGSLTLDGSFNFDLSGADTTLGDSWQIVDSSLTSLYDGSFAVTGFTDAGSDTWTKDINGTNYYKFSEQTGQLNVVPEPSTWAALLSGIGALGFFRKLRRNRRA